MKLTKAQIVALQTVFDHSPVNPFRTSTEVRAKRFVRLAQLGLVEMSQDHKTLGYWVWITRAGRAALRDGTK